MMLHLMLMSSDALTILFVVRGVASNRNIIKCTDEFVWSIVRGDCTQCRCHQVHWQFCLLSKVLHLMLMPSNTLTVLSVVRNVALDRIWSDALAILSVILSKLAALNADAIRCTSGGFFFDDAGMARRHIWWLILLIMLQSRTKQSDLIVFLSEAFQKKCLDDCWP